MVKLLTEAENGRQVALRAGDELVVRLKENPTTGFRWQAVTVEGLEAAGAAFQMAPAPQFGSGGLRELRFRVVSAGRLELWLWREWEGESSVTSRFDVRVLVE